MKPEQLKYSILKKAFSGQLVTCKPDSEKPKVKAEEYEEPPFDIPDDWFWSNLGNCCDMYTGNSISERVKKAKYTGLKEGYDYIATKDVTLEHTIEYDNGVKIPVDDNFKKAYSGSVLMCIEGGSAGKKIGIVDRDVCFGNKLCSFNSTEIVNTYIYYYLQSSEFKAFFMDNMTGIIGGVSIKKLKELPIPIPTVSEQKAIVEKLEELLPYVERYAVAYKNLEQFNAKFPEDIKKSILQYAIQGKLVEQRPEEGTAEELYAQIQEEKQKLIKDGKIKKEKSLAEITEDEIPFDIPDSWKWVRWGDIAQKIQYGYNAPAKSTGRIKMVRISDIQDNTVIWENVPFCDIPESDIDDYLLKDNDILFARTGGTVGKSFLVSNIKEEAIYAGYLIRTSYSDKLCAKYLKYYMGTQLYWNQLRNGTIATAQPNCNGKTLSKMILPLPPLEEQKRIVAKIEELLPYCNRLIK